MDIKKEKKLQESIPWDRSKYFSDYYSVLGYYQALACIEHGHGPSVLDLPCGDGTLTKIFADYFPQVTGVDIAKKSIDEARRNVPSGTFIESSIEELSLRRAFDSVFMINILEHVVDPVIILQKASELLIENGIIIVQVPNAHAINRKIAVIMGTLETCEELSPFDINIAGHRRSYTLGSLEEDIKKAGLKVVKTGGILYKMLSSAQMDWFLKNGLWDEGGFGWGRIGGGQKDWKAEFCRACYEIGKERPEDCNIIYACIAK